ncbi:MAG: L,D-transpeptidase family protein [Candidatus Aminicenantes bacterium]|nr:MAG: L,D-transpeptidase family protein [Candidatus Aminicenantes bacterium]
MKKSYRKFTHAWIFIVLILPGFFPAKDLMISAQVVNNHSIRINFNAPLDSKDTELILYRSTVKLADSSVNKVRYPITEFQIDTAQNPVTFFDHYIAHNVTYHYLAILRYKGQKKSLATSNTLEISSPNVTIEEVTDPVIFVNKKHYYLEIQDNEKMAKRYPISLGRDPFKRKIHQDNKTTPEGFYKITNLQTDATFYKAIDIDYPNAQDRNRYEFMKAEGLVPVDRGIGGEIQIHGKHPRFGSIQRNWTWGCISLRNTDVDEIFKLSTLKAGIPVIIFGHEFSLEDALSLAEERPFEKIKSAQKKLTEMGLYKGRIDGILGRQTQFAIGRYQIDQDLPISCVLDARTLGALLNRTE